MVGFLHGAGTISRPHPLVVLGQIMRTVGRSSQGDLVLVVAFRGDHA